MNELLVWPAHAEGNDDGAICAIVRRQGAFNVGRLRTDR